jgi:hypothetical protein
MRAPRMLSAVRDAYVYVVHVLLSVRTADTSALTMSACRSHKDVAICRCPPDAAMR